MAEVLLAQLAREPVPGRVKTRLQPPLSPGQAAGLHAAMVSHICGRLCDSGLGSVELWVQGDPGAALFRDCRSLGVAAVHTQEGDDLGARMACICRRGLARYSRVVLVGSDVPGLDKAYLQRAVAALDGAQAVIGPALDGGYVLLGLSSMVESIFQSMPWGTDRVLDITLARLAEAGIEYRLLEPLPDIDRPEDLQHLPASLRQVLRD